MGGLPPLSPLTIRRFYLVAMSVVSAIWVVGLIVIVFYLSDPAKVLQLLVSAGILSAVVASTLAFLKSAESHGIISANAQSINDIHRMLDLRRRKIEQLANETKEKEV